MAKKRQYEHGNNRVNKLIGLKVTEAFIEEVKEIAHGNDMTVSEWLYGLMLKEIKGLPNR